MYCTNCGAPLPENAGFCPNCGSSHEQTYPDVSQAAIRRGFSNRINDPAFARYIKNSHRWSAIFTTILALVTVIGFYISGERGTDGMENPQALYIGLGVGGMFLLIAFFSILSRASTKTWDGTVVNKTIRKKTTRQRYGEGYEDYLEYTVTILSDTGKKHMITAKNDDTKYNYYQIGDRLRHHAGLRSYEKYDKTGDTIIFCNACSTLCNINDDYCFRCKCPLLK